jgi:quercetin dioxygenase-like cupin family protein
MENENRRLFLGALAASLLPTVLSAQTPTTRAGELARHTLTGSLEGFDAVLVMLNIPAGAGSGNAHRHPGFVLGYVVEGQIRFAINNEKETIVPTGATFFEDKGALHTVLGSAKPDAPARVLAFMVVPKGSPLTSPA